MSAPLPLSVMSAYGNDSRDQADAEMHFDISVSSSCKRVYAREKTGMQKWSVCRNGLRAPIHGIYRHNVVRLLGNPQHKNNPLHLDLYAALK